MPLFKFLQKGLLFAFVLLIVSGTALGKPESERIREVEAAFLIQFCKYITWPASAFDSPDAPLIVGVVGRDPFGSVLDNIARTARIRGKSIEVRRYKRLPHDTPVQLLFIAADAMDHFKQNKEKVVRKPVVLVGKRPDFLKYGIINFVMVDKNIRFDISLKNSKKSGLKISSKLLQVAHQVQ